jgi:secreted PhoX family phosphatase
MTTLDRRTFLRLAASGLAAAGPMQALVASGAHARTRGGGAAAAGKGGYGRLAPVPEKDTGKPMLSLPEGFQYRAFGLEGTAMSDGTLTPGGHDGMAVFPVGRDRFRLVRNHEILPLGGEGIDQEAFGRRAEPPHHLVREPYDPEGPGGCSTLEVDAAGRLHRSWVSLNGTSMNCAGGPMPWGSWVSGEENVNGPDASTNFLGQDLDLQEKHGYLWEVPVGRGPGAAEIAVPITSAGRFNHEAVAWGHDGSLYLTEDNFDGPSGFYRYDPPEDPTREGRLADGGRLSVLVALDDEQDVLFEDPDPDLVPDWIPHPDGELPSADLRGTVGAGTTFRTAWVEIPVPDPDIPEGTDNTWASRAVVLQGWLQGAARFSRIEGCWFGDGKIFFNATSGGAPPTSDDPFRRGSGPGQVWSYDVASGALTLLFEPDDGSLLDSPDNITFSPQGSLLLCEDRSSSRVQKLVGLTLDGRPFDFALNNLSQVEPWASRTLADGSGAEWAGATFTRTGTTLFVNIQSSPAVTFAIWGPWSRGAL